MSRQSKAIFFCFFEFFKVLLWSGTSSTSFAGSRFMVSWDTFLWVFSGPSQQNLRRRWTHAIHDARWVCVQDYNYWFLHVHQLAVLLYYARVSSTLLAGLAYKWYLVFVLDVCWDGGRYFSANRTASNTYLPQDVMHKKQANPLNFYLAYIEHPCTCTHLKEGKYRNYLQG